MNKAVYRPGMLTHPVVAQKIWVIFENLGGNIDEPITEFPYGMWKTVRRLGFTGEEWKKYLVDPMYYPHIDEVKVERALEGLLPTNELTHFEFHALIERIRGMHETEYPRLCKRLQDWDTLLNQSRDLEFWYSETKMEKGFDVDTVQPLKRPEKKVPTPRTVKLRARYSEQLIGAALRSQETRGIPDEVIRAIRAEKAAGARNVDLAKKYGLGPTHVGGIVAGRLYSNVA